MPIPPTPTYAEVAFSVTDKKTGEVKHSFNPVWLSWFLSLTNSVNAKDIDVFIPPAAPPTVIGSRGGNAALASLLTGLAGLGIIVDSTTP